MAVKIAAGTPKPLSEARAGATAELEAGVERCLERDPAAGYQSVNELAEALRRVLPAYQGVSCCAAQLQPTGVALAASAFAVALAAAMFWSFSRGAEQKVQANTRTPPAALPPPAAVTAASRSTLVKSCRRELQAWGVIAVPATIASSGGRVRGALFARVLRGSAACREAARS